MSVSSAFQRQIETITEWLNGRAVEPGLAGELAQAFPVDGQVFRDLADSCRSGVTEGWLAQRGEPDLRWGRPMKPGPDTHGYSVDVVLMTDIAGPHHTHPNGEIDLVIPVDPGAKFDGYGEGWVVYAAGSSHRPTVSGGQAIVLYLLPGGEIAFSSQH